jgi:hypothetical protein
MRDLTQLRAKGLRVLARWGVALVALVVSLWTTGHAHSYFMRPYAVPVSNDEGYITAMVLRMVRGHWLPYVDAVSQRGPITYWLCALVMSIGGLFSWATLRWFSLGLAFGIIALVFLLGVELFSPFAAGIAVLVQTYFVTYELTPWDGLGYNGEIVAMQFVLLSALFVARAQNRSAKRETGLRRVLSSRVTWLFAAGALAACAGLSKQVTLLHVGPAVFWILVGPRPIADQAEATGQSPRERRIGWLRTRVRDFWWYFLGFAVPFAMVLGRYVAAGHLREFVYYFQEYGRDIFMAPLTPEAMRVKMQEEIDRYFIGIAAVSFLGLFAIARAARAFLAAPRGKRLESNAGTLFALLHFLAAAAGASFTWRFFGHYFVQLYPFVGLMAGYVASGPLEDMDERHLPSVIGGLVVVSGGAVLLAIANSALQRNVDLRRESDRWYQDPEADAIVHYVVQKTTPSDTIFVWGFRAETYVSARRFPASRYVYTVYNSGVVPWYPATPEQDASRVVPGSQQLLLSDLEETRPELVVDAGRSMAGRYMYQIPLLRTYLDKHYCFARYADGEPIYLRRHTVRCPRPDY